MNYHLSIFPIIMLSMHMCKQMYNIIRLKIIENGEIRKKKTLELFFNSVTYINKNNYYSNSFTSNV